MLCFWILPFKKVTKTLKGKILWLYQILFTLLIRDECSLQAPMPSHSDSQVMQRCLWVMPTQTIKEPYRHKILCISSVCVEEFHLFLSLPQEHIEHNYLMCCVLQFRQLLSASKCSLSVSSLEFLKTDLYIYVNNT